MTSAAPFAVDSMAAMNSFIQELRNLNSSASSASAMSNSSFDSGFSASFTGDSNAGSGRATAINAQPQQPQSSNVVWGNKTLWGVPPPSSSPAAIKSPAVDPSTICTNTNSNSMYANSKDSSNNSSGGSIWATALTASPSVPPTQSQSSNFSTNIWENSGTKANPEPLGSIWMIPDAGRANVWGASSQLLRPTEISSGPAATVGNGGGSRLSSLWGSTAGTGSSSTSSSGNVLKSLRLAGTVGAGGGGASASFGGLGGLITSPPVPAGNAVVAAAPATATSTMQLFSDDFLSYLNINN